MAEGQRRTIADVVRKVVTREGRRVKAFHGHGSSMFRPWLAVALAAGAMATLAGFGGSTASGDSGTSTGRTGAPWQAQLNKRVPAALKKLDLPGVIVGVWQGDKTVYLKAFGVADTKTRAPMRTDFHMRIGSLTKSYTVTGILQLVEDGKISLDDPIGKYVSGVPNGDVVTLRELANMRSGLGDYSTVIVPDLYKHPQKQWTPQELLDITVSQPVRFEPGTEFDYNNSNTVLLGLVIEKVSGMSFGEFIQERILDPLGLDDTSLPKSNAIPALHPHGYGDWNPEEKVEDVTDWNPSWGWAAGAMISDAQDIARWTRALARGELITPELQRERETAFPAPTEGRGAKYGLAYEIHPGGWQGHNGRIPGWTTYPYYLPAKNMTIVVLVNTSANVVGSWSLFGTIVKTVTPNHPWSKLPPN